jgi:hypothetical protein
MNIYERNWKGLWTLEWNEVQQKFHIESADIRFSSTIDDFLNCKVSEWYMVGIFNSYKEAVEFSTTLLEIRSNILNNPKLLE